MALSSKSSSSSSSNEPIKRPKHSSSTITTYMLLKDYLLDDLSSCSSNGFKSFPRRQHPYCCPPPVRFLLQIDLEKSKHNTPTPTTTTTTMTTISSALHRASEAFINAVKFRSWFTFKRIHLWRKHSECINRYDHHHACREVKEIQRWRSFGEFLEEDGESKPFDLIPSVSEQSKKESSVVTTATYTTVDTTNTYNKEWTNDEKQQFSPVSVLDCPFEDDEEEICSPFQRKFVRVSEATGNKQKLSRKTRRFEGLADQLKAVDLEKRINASIAQVAFGEEIPITTNEKDETEVKNPVHDEAVLLLNLFKARTPLATSDASTRTNKAIDKLLLDFFQENIGEKKAEHGGPENHCFEVVQDWVSGHPGVLYLGWEVNENRHVYIKDMEKYGRFWTNLDKEKEVVVLQLEIEIFASFVDELLHDMF